MKINKKFNALVFTFLFLSLSNFAFAQTKTLLTRTDFKTEKFDFGVGGTVSVIGAPKGSISIEGWQNKEVEIQAEIEIQAETEADLALLSKISGFAIDYTAGSARIISSGAYDKKAVKKLVKNFPKRLLGSSLKIDYKIKVPFYTDLEIDGGSGDFNLSNVEGAMRINFLESNAKLALVGGIFRAVIGSGTVDVLIASHNWRGRSTDIQLANGTMNVFLPLNFNAESECGSYADGQDRKFLQFSETARTHEIFRKIDASQSGKRRRDAQIHGRRRQFESVGI